MAWQIRSVVSKLLGHKKQESAVEIEWSVAPFLCDRNKISLDIGADHGGYARLICNHSKKCIAFEARPDQAAMIRGSATARSLPISVESVALSDSEGFAKMRVLTRDPGRGTIEPLNSLTDPDGSPETSLTVPKKCLDSYGLTDVGFIKIDVEGHELAVLKGAEKTIRDSIPNLLVEVEERHHSGAIESVSSFLATLGYEGFFILEGIVHPFADFDKSSHQNPANIASWKDGWKRFGIYVNNFFFLPAGKGDVLRRAVEDSGARRKQ
jgi:FkbM family methyltransferase